MNKKGEKGVRLRGRTRSLGTRSSKEVGENADLHALIAILLKNSMYFG